MKPSKAVDVGMAARGSCGWGHSLGLRCVPAGLADATASGVRASSMRMMGLGTVAGSVHGSMLGRRGDVGNAGFVGLLGLSRWRGRNQADVGHVGVSTMAWRGLYFCQALAWNKTLRASFFVIDVDVWRYRCS